jgi:hypothetical protein
MSEIKSLGKMINDWHAEWDASPELQFQFVQWNDYAFGRQLRRIWEDSQELQRGYENDFRKFSTAVKREAGIDYHVRLAAAAQNAEERRRPKSEGKVAAFVKALIDREFGRSGKSGGGSGYQ